MANPIKWLPLLWQHWKVNVDGNDYKIVRISI
ncbi:uncharacterized protein G2W53_039243 [Senna tora]|uniref:Uncharacterized protein n=1 Tax=Senna tora TaxID=362788 RepID=A0A834W2N6_9FABA|nr:uncharacterized protein G2W53_039243 [Senna tora]